ncbi:MAG: sulfotransferase domain-containing protein, partial [Bacteroidota bacterium]
YSKQLGFIPSALMADDYVKLLLEADSKKSPQHLRALEQGKYAQFLEHYLNLFGKQNILTTFHKDLQSDPGTFMGTVCKFLNIQKSYYNNFDFKVFNPSLNVKSVSHFNKYRMFKKKLRSYNNRLPQSYRNFIKKIFKPMDVLYLKTKTEKWTEKEIGLSSYNKKILSEYYQEDHKLLEKILDKKIIWQ